MQALIKIQAATIATRQRLADQKIATRAENGKIQVVHVDLANDKAEPIAISGWMPVSAVCGYLAAMQ